MPKLQNYHHVPGYHPTTATIAGALAYHGVSAPHRDGPVTEALLAGIAGGIALGYFYFAYEGYDPQVNIVTRNSFDGYGFDSVRTRLGISVDLLQTTSEKKGRENLIGVLEEGEVPIVWLDTLSLGYEKSELGEEMWSVLPVIVYAYEDEESALADRADAPIVLPTERVDRARARIKKERFKVATIDTPDFSALPEAVAEGIESCLALYFEKPPKGSAKNWGATALDRWQKLLRSSSKDSWISVLPTTKDLYAGLTTVYKYAFLYWKDDSETADRALYADFLDEASTILDNPALAEVAGEFRKAAEAWKAVANALLPESVPLLAGSRKLLHRRHSAFLAKGSEAMDEIASIDGELATARDEAAGLELSDAERSALQEGIADALERVQAVEVPAFHALRESL